MNPGDWVKKKGMPSIIGVIIKTVCDPLDGRLYADVLWSSSRNTADMNSASVLEDIPPFLSADEPRASIYSCPK